MINHMIAYRSLFNCDNLNMDRIYVRKSDSISVVSAV